MDNKQVTPFVEKITESGSYNYDEQVPDISDVEKFLKYNDYLVRSRLGQLTDEEQQAEAIKKFQKSIQQSIETNGKQEEISASIKDGTLVIINKRNDEVIYTWNRSDPESATKICLIVGTGK